MTLGQRIQELRKQTGMSQEKLGEALGVSRQAVSKWESDNGIPELDTLIAMSRLFGVTIGQLLGVEEPKQEKDGAKVEDSPKADARPDEKQVEDILRRYVEQTRPHPQKSRYGWKAPLIAVAGLAVLVVFLGIQIGNMRSTISNLNGRLSYLDSKLSNQIGNMEYRIQDILEEQSNLLGSFDSTVTGFDPEKESVTVVLTATLKTYTPGTQAQFAMTWSKVDLTTGETVSGWVDGPNFKAELELPMNFRLDGVLRLRDAYGVIQEQPLETISGGMHPEEFQLDADSLSALYSIAVGNSATVTAEDPAVRVYSPYPRLFQPVSVELTVTLSGEVLNVLPLTLTEETRGIWYGRSEQGVQKLSLSKGDELVFSLEMTDSLGRESVVTKTVIAGDDGPTESYPPPVIYE